jgi:Baseplate J-like protein
MASVFYLDVDDEITSAAARIRASEDPRVGLFVPAGSRIATSRINFRLLAREALERNRALSIIAPDPAARALAASAGLPAFATVGEYEASQADQAGPSAGAAVTGGAAAPGGATPGPGDTPDQPGADLPAAAVPAAAVVGARASGSTPGLGPSGPTGNPVDPRVGPRSGAVAVQPVRPAGRGRRVPTALIVTTVVLVALLLVLGLVGAIVLPSATITISAKVEPVGPLQLTVRADPSATSTDPVAGVVPALQLSQDFTSFGTFNATGKKTTTTNATGSVTFTSINTLGSKTFPSGSVVSTDSGIDFRTTSSLTLPRWHGVGPRPSGTVGITAVKGGSSGNVPAGAIDQLPPGFQAFVYSVTNAAATTGGTSTSTTIIQKSDTDAAVASLTKGLKQQFAAWLLNPDGLPPGSTAYPKTGVLSTASADTDPSTLVGLNQATFQLTMTATGTETAVDQATVSALAVTRIQAEVSPGYKLVPDSEKVTFGPTQFDGQVVVFPTTVVASQIRQLDPETLRQLVQGKSVDEARTILSDYGTVDIQTWPGFVSSISSLAWRLDLTIEPSGVTPSAGPSSSQPVSPTSLPSVPSSGAPSAAPTSAGSANP